jgi:hypothetical protein
MDGTRSKKIAPHQREGSSLPSEEEVLMKRVLELGSRGLPIRLPTLRHFASAITRVRGGEPVGVKWSYNFI